MKTFILILFFSLPLIAETWELKSGSGTYQVKHTLKRVEGESKELKGKINCPTVECELLIAAPVKTFVSSDSNRDLNMLQTVEAGKFPMTIARGKMAKSELQKTKWTLPAEIEFHGIKKQYNVIIEKLSEHKFKASFILLLDSHKVERPSLFGMKIEDEVPMTFDLTWSKSP